MILPPCPDCVPKHPGWFGQVCAGQGDLQLRAFGQFGDERDPLQKSPPCSIAGLADPEGVIASGRSLRSSASPNKDIALAKLELLPPAILEVPVLAHDEWRICERLNGQIHNVACGNVRCRDRDLDVIRVRKGVD